MVRLVKEATTWTVKLDFTFSIFMRGLIYILDFLKILSNICADQIGISQGNSTNTFILEQPNETKSTNFDPKHCQNLKNFEKSTFEVFKNVNYKKHSPKLS